MEAALGTSSAAPSGGVEDVLAFTVAARERVLRAEADQLWGALQWALLHATDDPEAAASEVLPECLGRGRNIPLAGPGTPLVEEFAVAELAAALGLTEPAANRLVGDALELAYRLPLTWERVQAAELPAWRGRRVAAHTKDLSVEAAGWVDRQVAPFAHQLSEGRVRDLVAAALLRIDAADPDRPDPAETRGVDFTPVDDGQVYLRALLDPIDGKALSATIDQVAEVLARLGDHSDLPVLRSRALGLLADPQLTLDVLTGAETDPAHQFRTTPGHPGTDPTTLTLYVHVSAEDLAAGVGVARVEGIGPLPLDRIREWAAKTHLSVRPVLDLADQITVDAYEIPHRLREQTLLRDPACVFPWCGNRTHHRDIDHITPFDDTGPPGQTTSTNLAPLCRFHHRLKTHSDWTYHRDPTGSYHWASPLGRTYTVTHQGTSTA